LRQEEKDRLARETQKEMEEVKEMMVNNSKSFAENLKNLLQQQGEQLS